MSLQTLWLNLLVDIAIAKNSHWIQSDDVVGEVSIDKVSSILVSGLLIRSVSILDESLIKYIDINNIILNKRYPKLYDRLLVLSNEGKLLNYSDIDKWRGRRNDVGHKITDIYTWEELEECLHSIYRELSNLNMLSEFPNLSATKTKQRVEPTKAGVIKEIEVTVQIHEKSNKEKVYHQFGWSIRVGG